MNVPMPWSGTPFAPPGGCCAEPHPSHACDCEGRPHYHSFCPQCCHPAAACCCGDRHCRKEARELLVQGKSVGAAQAGKLAEADLAMANQFLGTVRMMRTPAAEASPKAEATASDPRALTLTAKATAGTATAFIGGGCCVHLSVEYMPDNPLTPAQGVVAVAVTDSDKTVMLWAKVVEADAGYRIQEDIITTHPGAKLVVVVLNVTARVRWCEVFSC